MSRTTIRITLGEPAGLAPIPYDKEAEIKFDEMMKKVYKIQVVGIYVGAFSNHGDPVFKVDALDYPEEIDDILNEYEPHVMTEKEIEEEVFAMSDNLDAISYSIEQLEELLEELEDENVVYDKSMDYEALQKQINSFLEKVKLKDGDTLG